MPTVVLSPIGGPGEQFFDNNGNVLSGGKLHTYAAGTTTNLATYTTSAGSTAHSNPITLDSAGRVPNDGTWLMYGTPYKMVLKTSAGSTLGTWDNITGAATGVRTTATVATLAALTGMTDGDRLLVTDWGFYRYSAASTAAVNGASVVTAAGGTGRWLLEVEGVYFDSVFNVKDYGATGDGTTNDYTAIQAAITAAETASPNAVVYFPRGIYVINTGLVSNTPSKFVRFVGDGLRCSSIKAGAAITMLTLSANDGDSHTSKRIENLAFNANNLAPTIIDATYLRYSTIKDCRFTGMPASGYAIVIGNWVNRVLNNQFNASDLGNGMSIVAGAGSTNNMVIDANDFTSCVVGITVSSFPNGLIITKNTLDSCAGAAIWLKAGCRQIDIRGNYIEACGATGVSVETSMGSFLTVPGAIVAHTLYNVVSSQQHLDLKIEANHFANCSQDTYIALSSVVGATIRGNSTHDSYAADSFVRLFWQGAPYTTARRVLIDHVQSVLSTTGDWSVVGGTTVSNVGGSTAAAIAKIKVGQSISGTDIPAGTYVVSVNTAAFSFVMSAAATDTQVGGTITIADQFGRLVKLDSTGTSDVPRDTTSALVIKNYSRTPNQLIGPGSNLFGLPLNWSLASGTLSMGRDGTFDGDQVWKINGDGIKRQSVTLEDILPSLRGRYFRIDYISRGDTGAANALRARVYLDGVELYTSTVTTSTDWTTHRSPMFYVPKTTTTLRIDVSASVTTDPCWFTHFNVSLGDTELNEATPVVENLELSAAPAYGTWAVGDVVINSAPASAGYIGWVCTVAGSPGTWKGYGLIA